MANKKIELILGELAGITCKGTFTQMFYDDEKEQVAIFFRVTPVDADGNEIVSDILTSYRTRNVADNETMVDKATGALIDTQAQDYRYNPDTMCGQYDFFKNIAQNVSLKVDDLIMQYLQAAKANNAWYKR